MPAANINTGATISRGAMNMSLTVTATEAGALALNIEEAADAVC
jgi:hypothetical protein